MSKNIKNAKPYADLWGDRVALKQLALSALIGIVITMTCYIIASRYFLAQVTIEDGLARGYSLMIGIGGCIIAAAICSKLFKPKRIIVESAENLDIIGAIEAAGSTLEDEIHKIKKADPVSIAEMKSLGLEALLSLGKEKEEK